MGKIGGASIPYLGKLEDDFQHLKQNLSKNVHSKE